MIRNKTGGGSSGYWGLTPKYVPLSRRFPGRNPSAPVAVESGQHNIQRGYLFDLQPVGGR